eukprot:3932329-Rhodomonas_salina.1
MKRSNVPVVVERTCRLNSVSTKPFPVWSAASHELRRLDRHTPATPATPAALLQAHPCPGSGCR